MDPSDSKDHKIAACRYHPKSDTDRMEIKSFSMKIHDDDFNEPFVRIAIRILQ